MPQLSRGGKFIFGESQIRPDGCVRFPPQAVTEYGIASEGRIYLFTGSGSTGGFCVTRQGLLLPSRLGHILTDLPELLRIAGTLDFRVVLTTNGTLLPRRQAELLAALGKPADWLDDRPDCPYCGDRGYIGSKKCQCLLRACEQAKAGS